MAETVRKRRQTTEKSPQAPSGKHLEGVAISESCAQRLQRLLAQPSIAHLWVVISPSADLATTVARAFLLDWLGADRSISCHPDLLEVKTSGKIALHSIASISHMLEQLSLTPHGTKGRAILIEAADRMLPPTANAVLKALEEPPPSDIDHVDNSVASSAAADDCFPFACHSTARDTCGASR